MKLRLEVIRIYLSSRCCCRWFRSKRLESEIPSRTLRKKYKRRLIDEEVGIETYMPTDRISVPMIISVVVIFGYVAIGSFVRAHLAVPTIRDLRNLGAQNVQGGQSGRGNKTVC